MANAYVLPAQRLWASLLIAGALVTPLPTPGSAGTASFEDARDFLAVHLDAEHERKSPNQNDNGLNVYAWRGGDILDMTPSTWRWQQHEMVATITTRQASGDETVITYTVDPRQLVRPAEIVTFAGLSAIRVRCAVPDCISARGERARFTGRGNPATSTLENQTTSTTPVSSSQSSHAWPIGTRDTAQRVLNAVNLLLAESGARNSPF